MNRNETLSNSELDRELELYDSDEEVFSSSSDIFMDDTDDDPDYNPNELSTASRFQHLLSQPKNSQHLGLSDDSSDSEFEVSSRPVPNQASQGRTDQSLGRPSNISRQVISDSDSDVGPTDNSEWEDLSENDPPNFSHLFDFYETPGPKHIPSTVTEPIDFFKLLFTNSLLQLFVKETNKYATQTIAKCRPLSPRSRFQNWTPVTVNEMLAFIIVIFNMGLNIKPTIKAYWSKNDSQYMPWFGKMFARSRFENLLSFFHMVDNTKLAKPGQPLYDPCAKFQPLLDYCNEKFLYYYQSHKQISIDESLVGTKNQTSLMQYLPNKHHHRWGIKFWVACDSISKYCLKLFCYKGAKNNDDREEIKKFGLAYTVVRKILLACNYLQKGYHLFIDNFFTSLPLINWLYSEQTFVTGTIRKNKIGLPQDAQKKFMVGEKMYKKKGNIVFLAYREKKSQTKPVFLVSSNTKVRSVNITNKRRGRVETKEKPEIVSDYNKFMGGIDGFDQMLYCYLDERRTVKYWKKVTFNFFSRMLLNTYILYQAHQIKNNKKPLDRYQFIVSVISSVGDSWFTEKNNAGAAGDCNINRPVRELIKLADKKVKTCWVCSKRGGHTTADRQRKKSRLVCSKCGEGVHYQCFPKHKCT